ncbi:FecR family protein [Chitinophaga skermanii]|uniref:FecR family protein n=1 Tax=Chitinophaga skermanii TaxID=331697 RepID=A0A327QWD0_9BACT|nr:FecR family protein [Chitinophaga skermanii]RAJ08255.1 FecR family protein [Chitinophaga skermanii]
MNTNDNKNDINWDKLLDAFEGEDSSTSLTPEEFALLANAKEIQARLHTDQFDENIGWERFVAARDQKRTRVFRLVRFAAAAVILVAVGLGAWFSLTPAVPSTTIAEAGEPGKVKFKLSNGKVLEVEKTTSLQQASSGASVQVQADKAVYSAGDATVAANALDTLEVPRGMQFALQLSDGTRVFVNAGSRFVFPPVFAGATREVYVDGEAYLDVAANAQQPFIVHAGDASMKVLGTGFNVNNYSSNVITTLSSGKLLVMAANSQVVLLPGEQARFQKSNATLEKTTVDTRPFTAWKDGDIFFEDATLEEIATTLSRMYDYDVRFSQVSLEKKRFTIDMRRPQYVQDVFKQISQSDQHVQFKMEGRVVKIVYQP